MRRDREITLNTLLMNQVLKCFITISYLWRSSFEAIRESRIVK